MEEFAITIIFWNTNIHNDNIGKSLKLSREKLVEFSAKNLAGKVSREELYALYDRIAKQEFESKVEWQEQAFKRIGMIENELGDIFSGEGTKFLKYGRRGKPHFKQVYITEDQSRLFWGEIKNGMKKKMKWLWLKEVQEVLVGSDHTKVMKKQKIPPDFDNQCLSIITAKRSLNLRNESPVVI
mmetsp:Transcript_39488/g.37953  ORF Transcript_39488/g.37953 Transcript_39488/m.37953 type:complete len:183 (-) Transcript_39488:312-860(-)